MCAPGSRRRGLPPAKVNPDLFVEVNGAEDIGIETGTVYRITRHWWTVDLERFDAESSFEAVRVFVPEAEPPA